MTWIQITLGALGLAFVLAELIARALFARRGRYYVWPPYEKQLLKLDPEGLPALPGETRIEFNADGERGDPLPSDWSETYRVLVAGGSAAECWFMDQPSTWPQVIQRELSTPERLARLGARRVHVGNVARSLVPCETIHELLTKTLPRYERLDAIVFMVGASDVVAWLEAGTPPVLAPNPVPTDRTFAEHPETRFRWSPSGLALRRVLARLKRRFLPTVDVKERAGKRMVEYRAMRARAREILTEVPDPAPLVTYFDRHFRAMIELARAHADRVIVARQPWLDREFTPDEAARLWNFGRGRPYREEVEVYYAHAVVAELMRTVDGRQRALAHELGVEEIDLPATIPCDFDHYYDYLHFTQAGCAAVGRAVADRLAAAADEPDPAGRGPDGAPQKPIGLKTPRAGSR